MRGLILPYRGVWPQIHPTAFVAPNATIIGNVTIEAEASIWFGCILRGDTSTMRIGARSNIQDGCVLHVGNGAAGELDIGTDVLVGHMVLVHSCRIGDGAFVGMHSTVMDTAAIATGAMLAAGSLLPPGKLIPQGEMWGGRPARKIRDLGPQDAARMSGPSQHYVELAREYRQTIAELEAMQ